MRKTSFFRLISLLLASCFSVDSSLAAGLLQPSGEHRVAPIENSRLYFVIEALEPADLPFTDIPFSPSTAHEFFYEVSGRAHEVDGIGHSSSRGGRPNSDAKIFSAINRLRAQEPPVWINQRSIAREAGVIPQTVTERKKANPTIAMAIEKAALSVIERLEAQFPPINQESTPRTAGVSVKTVAGREKANPTIATAIEEAALKNDVKIFSAIALLKAQEPPVPINQGFIARAAGVSENIIRTRRKENPAIAKAIEEAALSASDARILSAIKRLKAQEPPVAINPRTIARAAGVSVITVTNRKMINPTIAKAIEEAALLESDAKILLASDGKIRSPNKRQKVQRPPVASIQGSIAQVEEDWVEIVRRHRQANEAMAMAIEESHSRISLTRAGPRLTTWRPLIIIGLIGLTTWALGTKHVEVAFVIPFSLIQLIENRIVAFDKALGQRDIESAA
jgi:hypothetical protein